MRGRRIAVLSAAAVLITGAVTTATVGPPLVASDSVDPGLREIRPDFRYRPQAALNSDPATATASVRDRRWQGSFDPDDEFDLLEIDLDTGRHYLSYSVTGTLLTQTPMRMECRLVEKESGIALAPQTPSVIEALAGETVRQREALLDLPAMTVGLVCAPDTLGAGVFTIGAAEITAYPVQAD